MMGVRLVKETVEPGLGSAGAGGVVAELDGVGAGVGVGEAARLVSTPVTSRLKALAAKKAEEQAAMRRRARQVANLPPLAERKRGDWWDH
ncbi:hypothetical protein OG625_38900 [Streptomyces sp. NBC_01351]|uniref:hypothetical protein n=1 Tax=Streptomyces sp. NBC_01351 TaxID=2903833 RepID=UPI002E34ADC1|nr:hypothetical protein [Streptomyces sp. NBC_01351]